MFCANICDTFNLSYFFPLSNNTTYSSISTIQHDRYPKKSVMSNKFIFSAKLVISVSLARPQLASTTEIPAEAKAITIFLRTTTSTTTCSTVIKDSVPKLKIDFLSNHCSDFDKILYLKTLCVEPQHDSFPQF